jgi:hypothetical protein
LKLQRFFAGLSVVLLIMVLGFSVGVESKGQTIKVQKRVGDDTKYEDLKEVTESSQVLKAKVALDETIWEKAKMEMNRPPDYKFVFQSQSSEKEDEVVLFQVWITPNKERVGIIKGYDQYAKLTKEHSAKH